MGYPGDQGKPGGWSDDQPPQPPYGPGSENYDAAPYGQNPFNPPPENESPFAPRRGESFNDPFGNGAAGAPGSAPGWDMPENTSSMPPGMPPWPEDVPGTPGSLPPWPDEGPGAPAGASSWPDSATATPPSQVPWSDNAPPSGQAPWPDNAVAGQGAWQENGLAGPPAPNGAAPDLPDTSSYGFSSSFGSAPAGSSFGPSFDSGQPGPQFDPSGRPQFGGQAAQDDELYGATGERYFAPGGPDELGNGRGATRSEARSERRNNLPLIIGGAVVAGLVLIGGGFGLSAVLKDDSKPKAKAQQSASENKPNGSTSPSPKPSKSAPVPLNAKLKSRTTDPKPLTLNEIFSKKNISSQGQKYVLAGRSVDKNCLRVLNGAKLTAIVKKAGCTQALRGTFARGDGKLIGTVGVLNLRSEAAAKAVVQRSGGKDAYLRPLAGSGATKKIGKGAGMGTIAVRGHYILMTWVQRPDGKEIPASQNKVVSAFGQQVILGSNLSRALYYRGIEGQPLKS